VQTLAPAATALPASPGAAPAIVLPLPRDAAREIVQRKAASALAEVVNERGGTAAGWVRRAQQNFRTEVADAPVEIAIHGRYLDGVLDGGGYRNFFEVAEQFPDSVAAGRVDAYREMHAFAGLARDAPASARPIYAYANTGAAAHRAADAYGGTRLVLRDAVKERLTYTANDSMTPLVDQRMLPATLDTIDEAFFGDEIGKWIDTRNTVALYNRVQYVEAQIYGGVTLRDIDAIVFDYTDLRVLSRERFAQLQHAGVSIQVKDDPRVFRSFAQLLEEYREYVN
jgi:hypothetical protein